MFKGLSQLIRKFMSKPKRAYKSEVDRKLWQVVEDLTNPVIIDWELSDSDHRVLSNYVEIFLRDGEIDTCKMVVSPDLYPKLHRFIVALQGQCPWQESMAAYDYLEEKWPQLGPLLDKA